MGSSLHQLRYNIAEHFRAADVNQSLGSFTLLGIKSVFGRHCIEIVDNALAKREVLAKIKKQTIEIISGGGRMLVELETGILELKTTVFLQHFERRIFPFAGGNEAHHTMPVMPCRCVLKQFPRDGSYCSQHDRPAQH